MDSGYQHLTGYILGVTLSVISCYLFAVFLESDQQVNHSHKTIIAVIMVSGRGTVPCDSLSDSFK